MKLKELADSLGLSQTTVSRALNGYPEVNETTRSRVVEAARRLHYRPNASARRLATGRVGAIGAVLHAHRSQLIDPHYVEFLAGVGERLAEDEIDIVLSPTKVEGEETPSYRRIATGKRVDALILSSPPIEDERVKLRPRGRVLIPTGLVIELPAGYEAQVRPRSGLAVRHGVTVLNSPGTVDSDYRGEVKVLLVNLGEAPFAIVRGDRIAQVVIQPVSHASLVEVKAAKATARAKMRCSHLPARWPPTRTSSRARARPAPN